jgi:EAL domain-containing protein (putative c-di-GMP-specific phosphodiesterase class I)/CheY-like chemotaxis protein
MISERHSKGRILLVDDEVLILRGYTRALRALGYDVEGASDGRAALRMLAEAQFDVIVSDITMPEMNGLQLLRAVREHDLDVPVVLMTGGPSLQSAMQAVEYGAFRYLAKPFELSNLVEIIEYACRLRRVATMKREALDLLGSVGKRVGDRAGLEASFERSLGSLYMDYQPIICWSKRAIYGYEALVRSYEVSLPRPEDMLDAAERLGRLHELGRSIRDCVAGSMATANNDHAVFVNIHTHDLLDDTLYAPDSPLSKVAHRIVLEITERASLERVHDVRSRITLLRGLGFRIALDDLGAGYAGLTSFAQLEPEVVKLDMSLVHEVDKVPTKRKLIRTMNELCKELGMLVITEGVETAEERDTLVGLECDLLQGYLFGKPAKPFEPPLF